MLGAVANASAAPSLRGQRRVYTAPNTTVTLRGCPVHDSWPPRKAEPITRDNDGWPARQRPVTAGDGHAGFPQDRPSPRVNGGYTAVTLPLPSTVTAPAASPTASNTPPLSAATLRSSSSLASLSSSSLSAGLVPHDPFALTPAVESRESPALISHAKTFGQWQKLPIVATAAQETPRAGTTDQHKSRRTLGPARQVNDKALLSRQRDLPPLRSLPRGPPPIAPPAPPCAVRAPLGPRLPQHRLRRLTSLSALPRLMIGSPPVPPKIVESTHTSSSKTSPSSLDKESHCIPEAVFVIRAETQAKTFHQKEQITTGGEPCVAAAKTSPGRNAELSTERKYQPQIEGSTVPPSQTSKMQFYDNAIPQIVQSQPLFTRTIDDSCLQCMPSGVHSGPQSNLMFPDTSSCDSVAGSCVYEPSARDKAPLEGTEADTAAAKQKQKADGAARRSAPMEYKHQQKADTDCVYYKDNEKDSPRMQSHIPGWDAIRECGRRIL